MMAAPGSVILLGPFAKEPQLLGISGPCSSPWDLLLGSE
jgi:hypothetical protein